MDIDSGVTASSHNVVCYAGVSDKGRVRSHNEDSFILLPHCTLFGVADGVGGLDAGEIASKNAIASIVNDAKCYAEKQASVFGKICSYLFLSKRPKSLNVRAMISDANNAVYSQAKSCGKRMATTIVVMQLYGKKVVVGHVGDSRAYLLRNNILGQVTIDHSMFMGLLMAGTPLTQEQLDFNSHTITKALGGQQTVDSDEVAIDCQIGDMFLLCSDGLTDMVEDAKISQIMSENLSNVSSVVKELVDSANSAGGKDNVTVVGVKIDGLRDV